MSGCSHHRARPDAVVRDPQRQHRARCARRHVGHRRHMAYTSEHGRLWLFVNTDHNTAEAWTPIAHRGNRSTPHVVRPCLNRVDPGRGPDDAIYVTRRPEGPSSGNRPTRSTTGSQPTNRPPPGHLPPGAHDCLPRVLLAVKARGHSRNSTSRVASASRSTNMSGRCSALRSASLARSWSSSMG